ncbi:MAG: hypothetical protein OJJ54_09310 [Pseudonocardia sp.]|nr:hypothetical protein [Pseudonocardia sp.]
MLVRTDDEVYRVDSVWLGPPRATFPWRARYVSYGVGLLAMILVMFLQRRVGIGLSFFSVAWGLIITVLVTRLLGKRIDYERPLGQVFALFSHEVTGPRARSGTRGGPVRAGHVRIRPAAGRGVAAARPAPARDRPPVWRTGGADAVRASPERFPAQVPGPAPGRRDATAAARPWKDRARGRA